MEIEKVTKEQAEKEINNWLDKKKVFQSTREELHREIDVLIDGMCEGYLTLDDKFIFTHKIMIPEQVEGLCTQLKYKLRLSEPDMTEPMKGVKTSDGEGRLNAIISALTGEAKSVIRKLDTQDKKLATSIAVFFL
jgi:hypothetical protein